MRLYSDVPITGVAFDTLGRKAVAERLLELLTLAGSEQPIVIGLTGAAGAGKTSVVNMVYELLGDRADLCSLAIDAWTGGDSAYVASQLTDGVTKIFAEAKVVGGAEKIRERLFSAGDVVSTVARFAGVKVDVKGALERSADGLRTEVMKLTEALGKRIVVVVDHVDRLTAAEQLTVLRMIERWGRFPHFAFIVALDRARVVHALRSLEGDRATLDRVLDVELALAPVDRRELVAWVRRGIVEIATAAHVDPEPVLALFDPDGPPAITTARDAKRLLNALVAGAPLTQDLEEFARSLLARFTS